MTEEFRNYQFSKAIRGYNVDQVQEYIEKLTEMYDELQNENKELTLRYEQIAASLEEKREIIAEAQKTNAERDSIIAAASAKADEIVLSAEQRSQKLNADADAAARTVIEKAQGRAASIIGDADATLAQAQADASRLRADVANEAKNLIRATKVNCVKRLDECSRKVSEANAEYETLKKKAADFKAALFDAYSTHILNIENLEIPNDSMSDKMLSDGAVNVSAYTELDGENDTVQTADSVVGSYDPTDATAADTSHTLYVEADNISTDDTISDTAADDTADDGQSVDAETVDVAVTNDDGVTFDSVSDVDSDADGTQVNVMTTDDADVQTEKSTAQPTAEKKTAEKLNYTGFAVEKEYSGQVHYDSSDISSVNKKLDDIVKSHGTDTQTEKKNPLNARRLGFMK